MAKLNSKPHVRTAKVVPLKIDELEAGLRTMARHDTDLDRFWEENVDAFRQTVLLAIRDTSDALLSPAITLPWRVRLERELQELVSYIELADRYVATRLNGGSPARQLPSAHSQIH